MSRDLNKERADAVKRINYLFQDPSRTNEVRESVVEKLQEIVSFLSQEKAAPKKKTSK